MAEEVGLKYGEAMAAAMGPNATALDAPTSGAVHRSFRTALHAVRKLTKNK